MPQRQGQLKYREDRGGNADENGSSSGSTSRVPTRANIRTWIHERAVSRLKQILWEGQGSRLLQETTANPAVKKFLDTVPQVLAAIKEVHALAISNSADLLKERTTPPAPRELLLSKDSNGLTPLHKAAGLGNSESVRVLVERSLESVRARDDQGKLPLHYAAYAVGSSGVREENKEVTYHLLVEAGSDESQADNRGKTASYYLQHPGEVDPSRLLVIPEAPRTAKSAEDGGITGSALWMSWRLLIPLAPVKKRTAEDSGKSKKEREPQPREKEPSPPIAKPEEVQERSEGFRGNVRRGAPSEAAASLHPPQISPPPSPPPKPPPSPSHKDSSFSSEHPPSPPSISPPEDRSHTPTNQTSQNFPTLPEDINKQTSQFIPPDETEEGEEFRKNAFETIDWTDSDDKVTASQTQVDEEASSVPQETRGDQEMTSKITAEVEKVVPEKDKKVTVNPAKEASWEFKSCSEEKLTQAVLDGDIGLLISIVVAGEGSRLIGLISPDPKTQGFLYDVPMQMEMIREIHEAASNGAVNAIQERLDRRKFAVAKEPSIGATPLHSAVLGASRARRRLLSENEGSEAMIRYLGGRFPESLNQRDRFGRTPLHYCTALPDEGTSLHLYEVLRQLGADSTIEDKLGHTPAYYLANPKDFPHEDLLPYMEYINWRRKKIKDIETSDDEEDEEGEEPKISVITPPGSSSGSASSNSQDPAQSTYAPVLLTEEGQYLAKSLGEPLVKGLTEVSQRRPKDPVGFLAEYLKTYTKEFDATAVTGFSRMDQGVYRPNAELPVGIEQSTEVFRNREDRDEHGQTEIHKAAGRSGRRGALLHLIRETGSNVALRDDMYRTPRDIAARFGLQQNVREIDAWIVTLASAAPVQGSQAEREILEAEAATNMLKSILLEGYDHILDATSSYNNGVSQESSRSKKKNLLDEVKNASYLPVITLLKSIPMFEERREWLHSAIRAGSLEHAQEILLTASESFEDNNSLSDSPPVSLPTTPSLPNTPVEERVDRNISGYQEWNKTQFNSSEKLPQILDAGALAIAKNRRGRCSLHVAVLCQQLEIASFIAENFPQTLHIGDNLERTPLHYALAVESVESFSLVLIQAGAKRIVKDLKGKQPSYYFINKSDIQKLQDEETLRE